MNELKTKIIKANLAYRTGDAIISDEEYDNLLDELKKSLSKKEYELFANTLTEPSGKIKHQYVIGSLNKIKADEADETGEFKKFITKHNVTQLFVTEKLDGCSFVARYYLGSLVQASTRGDGYYGVDITEKVKQIKSIPNKISTIDDITVRGEILICGDDYKNFGFKNRRNSVAGILNEDEVVPEKLELLSAKCYQVLSSDKHILRQYADLMAMGFQTPKYELINYSHVVEEYLPVLLANWRSEANYDMDGLVISSNLWTNENDVYKPEKRIAFKVNAEGVKTTIADMEWTQGKNGAFIPVAILDPIEMDGVTVSRVHALNAEYVKKEGLGIGSEVKIVRSGEIIPKIVEILKTVEGVVPTVCPSCGEKLEWVGVDIKCLNEDCGASKYKTIKHFIVKLGIEKVSDATLENLGIDSFEKLASFTPDQKYKVQTGFYREINNKLFGKSEVEIFSSMSFDGAGQRNVERILDHYYEGKECAIKELKEIEQMFINNSFKSYPVGMGEKIFAKIKPTWSKNLKNLEVIMNDDRFKAKENVKKTVKTTKKSENNMSANKLEGKTFCITGTLSKPRKHFETLVVENGGKIAAVSGKLSYLLVGEDSGSKLDKAKKLGVAILTEKDFMGLI